MPAFGDIARNLLNLEINTILCDGITAEKMPSVPEALRDVAQRYHRFLQNRIGELEEAGIDISATLPQLTSSGGVVAFENWHVLNAELATFEILRRAAQCCIAALRNRPMHSWSAHQIILERIGANAEQIREIYRGLSHASIAPDADSIDITASLTATPATTAPLLSQAEVVLLRKIWEIGTEAIAMQTVVLIDGDVFNRVQSGWETDDDSALHALHRQSVEACVTQWTNLFRIAVELIGSVFFQGFFRDSPPGSDSVPRNA